MKDCHITKMKVGEFQSNPREVRSRFPEILLLHYHTIAEAG